MYTYISRVNCFQYDFLFILTMEILLEQNRTGENYDVIIFQLSRYFMLVIDLCHILNFGFGYFCIYITILVYNNNYI